MKGDRDYSGNSQDVLDRGRGLVLEVTEDSILGYSNIGKFREVRKLGRMGS